MLSKVAQSRSFPVIRIIPSTVVHSMHKRAVSRDQV